MKLIIGLGNPGKEYEKTRHNVGFMVLDSFSKKNDFPEFKNSKKFKSLISKASFDKKRVILAKPQTFMNSSGKAVKILSTNYKIPAAKIFVIHDDIDLDLGKIKIVKNRGTAGHNGVESVVKELKTKDFIRFRVGIRPAGSFTARRAGLKNMKSFVLKNFTKKQKEVIKKSVKLCIDAIELTLKQGLEKAMNSYN